MSSASQQPAQQSAPQPAPEPSGRDERQDRDRTARARILHAAIARFADDGVDGTSMRAIAEAAGVSAPLIVHHFGSKDALRVECDRYVAATIREQKQAGMSGSGMDPIEALRRYDEGPQLLRYLARTLVDGSPHVAELVDEMVADAVAYMADGERSGVLKPTAYPEGRAAVLTLWSLGALVLHEHARRLLGVDITGNPANAVAYFLPASEILSSGVITEEAYEQVLAAFRRLKEDGS